MKIFAAILLTALSFGCSAPTQNTADSQGTKGISEVSPSDANASVSKAYSQFIDVRTPEEYASGHADRAQNIPLDTLAANLDRLEKNEPVYIICRTDNRSRQAAKILSDAGFKQSIVVTGGTEAWRSAGLPIVSPNTPDAGKVDEKTRQALLSALVDERRAFATYQAVLAKYPDARPFSNIVNAEQRHESFILPLFAKYALPTPVNEFDPAKITVPASLIEACKAGVEAEKANVALYDGFLTFVKEPDIRDVFTRLRAASSDNHLPAFIRCSQGGGRGAGKGRPF